MSLIIVTHLCLVMSSITSLEMDLDPIISSLFCVPQYTNFYSEPYNGKCYKHKDFQYVCKTKTIYIPKEKERYNANARRNNEMERTK